MDIQINREIKDIKETIYFGMNLRQLICSILAVIICGMLFFVLREKIGAELCSWICALVAFPFAMAGFWRPNGLNAEQFIWLWFKSEFLIPRRLLFKSTTLYTELTFDNQKKSSKRKAGEKQN